MGAILNFFNSRPVVNLKRNLAKATGLHVKLKRFTASASDDLRVAMLLNRFGIETIIDIGANQGQFAESVLSFGYKGQIISFEPGFEVSQILQKNAAKYPNWTVGKRCAIGNFNGEVDLNISANTVFNSILKITDDYATKKRDSRIVKTEKVALHTLDSLVKSENINLEKKLLLKIDTQGFEKQVLAGAEKVIEKVVGIKIEIPLHPIYSNVDYTFYDIAEFMKKHGFNPYSLQVEGVDLKTGRVNTMDGLFFRDEYYLE